MYIMYTKEDGRCQKRTQRFASPRMRSKYWTLLAIRGRSKITVVSVPGSSSASWQLATLLKWGDSLLLAAEAVV